MLYEITVIDTNEHAPSGYSSSAKYNEAHHFGTFLVEAPAYQNFGRGVDDDGYARRRYRIPEAVIAHADAVAQQYLPNATYDRTVLVEISVLRPARAGFQKDNGGAMTQPVSSYLLNSEALRRDQTRRHRILASMD